MTKYLEPLKVFLRSHSVNSWIKVGVYQVYVRKGIHCVGNSTLETLDIANISTRTANRGKGKFRQLMLDVQQLLETQPELRQDIRAIYIESVMNPRLAASLPSMGFKIAHATTDTSYVKRLKL